ncbi:hypothetical protein CTAYLR_004761 [Chrysophaeum taylorii]|uniref:Phosphofructokinase domain-containing protein n=1 Tax=Chrysophaeum taylorii TaxID=2483200 RepID=A0AAD7U7K4_9STRA|nr:hypothetical protein CTAYLR_004761 [Chrysophaeum taylorii]
MGWRSRRRCGLIVALYRSSALVIPRGRPAVLGPPPLRATTASESLDVVRPRCVVTDVVSVANPARGPYVEDDEVVLAKAAVHLGARERVVAYVRAGPRSRVSLDASATCAIVTCGGLCPGLNAVVQEVARCLWTQYGVRRVLGVEGGYAGLVAGRLRLLEPRELRGVYEKGGTILGTSRGRRDPGEMVRVLEAHGVDALFVVGGDGTIRGARAICDALPATSAIRVVAVPKTIDNDIPLIDRSFGFLTAVAKAKEAIDTAVIEARAFPRGVGVVRLMGRNAGFLAAHAALAAPGDVDAVLLPEKGFALDPLLDYLGDRLAQNDAAVVVVAEGVNARLRADERAISDVGLWLCDKLRDRFKGADAVALKYIDPSYAVRACASNAADTILCSRLATNAVHAAAAGFTDCAVGTINAKFALLPLSDLASRASILAVTGRLYADLVRSTGQPEFSDGDLLCDDADLETPSGGCFVTYD